VPALRPAAAEAVAEAVVEAGGSLLASAWRGRRESLIYQRCRSMIRPSAVAVAQHHVATLAVVLVLVVGASRRPLQFPNLAHSLVVA
jgi:plasmid stabilization system protein ParE